MPNALLARFFHERGLLLDLDFAAISDSNPDSLFSAWLELPKDQRHKLDGDFRDIFGMSCEKGFIAIINEAE